jgi:hypothetical protein
VIAAAASWEPHLEPGIDRPFQPPPVEREVAASPVPNATAPGAHFARTFDASSFRRGNLHTHSSRSDGDSDPADVYAWYLDHGYDFIAVTDHNTFTDPTDYRAEPGREFLVIGGEEVTMVGAGRQVHVNALCTDRRLPGGKFPTVASALAHGVGEIREAGGIALINHPNFTWGIGPADLPSALGAQLFEVYSGHPSVRTLGNPSHPSSEALWDMALTAGLDFAGVAVDDAHHLRNPTRTRLSHPGRAWVEVFSESLDRDSICGALASGLLYASTGPSLARVAVTDDTYVVCSPDPDSVVQFIGVEGRRLLEQKLGAAEPCASYKLVGSERYVRARVHDAMDRAAWTPAVRVVGAPINTSASEPTRQPATTRVTAQSG